MNEKNALNQLKLSEETSRLRRQQFQTLAIGLVNYEHDDKVKASITYCNLALLLIQVSNQLEDLIVRETEQAKSQMQKMQDLPDDEQWEYRIAYTLGVIEALNKIGSLQNQLREHTQSALHKASLLALSANGKAALPVHRAGLADNIHAIEEGANARQNKRMKDIFRLGVSLAQVFQKDAQEHESTQALTIASICANASDLTTSTLLVALGNLVTDQLNSPATVRDDVKEQWFTAQAIAAGIIGGLITEIVQKNEPWLAISLN